MRVDPSTMRYAREPRARREPLAPSEGWSFVEEWLDSPMTWTSELSYLDTESLYNIAQVVDGHGDQVNESQTRSDDVP